MNSIINQGLKKNLKAISEQENGEAKKFSSRLTEGKPYVSNFKSSKLKTEEQIHKE